jgi:hypothetical protein
MQQKKTTLLQKEFYSATKRKASKLKNIFSFQLTAFTDLFFFKQKGKHAVFFRYKHMKKGFSLSRRTTD